MGVDPIAETRLPGYGRAITEFCMKTFAFLIALVATAVSVRAGIETGPILNPANGHYYYLLTSDTWTNSEAQAVSLGGHLVTINDDAENAWVVDTFAHYGNVMRPLWIGLTDRDSEGVFGWVSGQPFTYQNWNTLSGEPNNSGGGGYEEDFGYIVEEDSGNPSLLGTFWNDAPEDGQAVAHPVNGVVEVESLTPEIKGNNVCWNTLPGFKYQAQWKPAHSRGPWHNFGPVITGTGEGFCVTDTPRPRPQFIYRVIFMNEALPGASSLSKPRRSPLLRR